MTDQYIALLDTADSIIKVDLHPARLRTAISDLSKALRETSVLLTESRTYALALEAELQHRAEKAEAERDRLREALEPFAAKANGYDGIPPAKYWGDTSFVMRHYDDEEVSVTLGNLRNARAALNTGREPSHD